MTEQGRGVVKGGGRRGSGRVGLFLGGAAVLSGCAVGPDFHRPAAPRTHYVQGGVTAATTDVPAVPQGAAQTFTAGADIPADWWTLFHYPELDRLVRHVLERSPTLEAATKALLASQQDKKASESALYPSVSGMYNPARFKTSRAYSNVPLADNWNYTIHTAQLNISYSPDLWGGVRRQVESAKAQRDAQRYQLEATWLTLTSSAVNAAISYAMVREQIRTTQEMIAAQERILNSTIAQQALGNMSGNDVAMQRTLLAQTRAGLPDLRQTLATLHDEIAALANDMPDAPTPEFELDRFHLPENLPVSLPAQLIDQRPDIRTAQEYFHSACALVGVAVANRLPNVQLGFSPGFAAATISQMAVPGYGQWTLGAMLTQPLFDGFQLQHQEKGARLRYDQAAAQYRSTIASAVQDVADSLNAVHNDAEALTQASEAASQAGRTATISQVETKLGALSQVALLNVQTSSLQTRLSLVEARAARLSDTVGLFQSLGGGWWNRTDDPANSRAAGGSGKAPVAASSSRVIATHG
ncbi:efflux transporter outer membrane subunit [Acetobacter oeni]|uniref:Histidine kinase n=1 Tax=Acetobacter oeni TaxID=304077 RepID=A0A511XLJ4_9PROT|nr:efflux transporter outer membrane subunit [Acetobacter oeni]MBB3883615.1 NodT family efflux transporter outer membrane factor (OMF) lipoprotein [Acetobacter oeni]NHO19650.1 efflux transporter outer membrane subunit [Acetobacter oeni]GBR02712.1 outer membrane channel lipoprotein [Acetobacter oeni LMG 21952]GEN63820.1 histidine kinase [Acetobacter oeni]